MNCAWAAYERVKTRSQASAASAVFDATYFDDNRTVKQAPYPMQLMICTVLGRTCILEQAMHTTSDSVLANTLRMSSRILFIFALKSNINRIKLFQNHSIHS